MNNKDNGLLSTLVPRYNRNTHFNKSNEKLTHISFVYGETIDNFYIVCEEQHRCSVHDNSEISLPLYSFLWSLFYFQLIRQKRHRKKKRGVKSKLTSYILMLRDMKLMKET